jgi:HNH endonuclease
MIESRVKRGTGPKSKMTKASYREKALPHLLKDFEKQCAYCLDPSQLRHPSQNHVDHFDCKLKERKRHQYSNLMLSCGTCNICKHDKPVVNKYNPEQRLLNCTTENEFLKHIRENEKGEWEPQTPAGFYHIRAIGLDESCHNKKRLMRRNLANSILELYSKAIQYVAQNPRELHDAIMSETKRILIELENMPPMVTESGVVAVKDWLSQKGVKLD